MNFDLMTAMDWHNEWAGFILGQSIELGTDGWGGTTFRDELRREAEEYAIHARLLWEMSRAGEV